MAFTFPFRSLVLRLGLAAVALVILAPGAAAAQVVRSEAGQVAGVGVGPITVFKAVPYAAPPLGQLRWRPPQPVAPWKGVRRTTAFAPACMQTGVSMPGETPPAVSEDCLYLNIWTPAHRPAGAPAPVMVWIHGGGFANGSAAMPLYWGDRLAAKGVVVVTVAYRLGPFGYLAHPELTQEAGGRGSGNYGLLDQVAALAWVRRNISAFGGDPERVTIAGQSAGAMSVSLLMSTPLAKGLFQRAIGQSGGIFEPIQLAPNWLLANAEKEGQAYASVGAHSLAELRRLPATALLGGGASAIAHPVIEPVALPASPYDVFAAGRQNDVPILVGSNAEEARSLTDLKPVTAANYQALLEKQWGALPPPIVAAYPFRGDDQARTARADLERDLRFGWDMWSWARLQTATGRQPVHSYYFTHKPPFPADGVEAGWGASHFADLWYMSDHLDQYGWAWSAGDRRLAAAMSGYWVNFIKTGDPNGPGLPEWPAYDPSGQKTLYLDDPITVGRAPNLKPLGAFDAVYDQVRGAPFKTGRPQ